MMEGGEGGGGLFKGSAWGDEATKLNIIITLVLGQKLMFRVWSLVFK